MIAGKLIAGLLGLLVAGIPGLFFGLVLGHLFDRGLGAALGFGGARLETVREEFFRVTFQLMGYVAKCDGRVSEEEVAHTENLFRELGLGDEQRLQAIVLFKEGADDDFSSRTPWTVSSRLPAVTVP
jgi:DnaJ like chaperone protein